MSSYCLWDAKTAIDNGLERSPERAASAQPFLDFSVPSLIKTVEEKNKNEFMKKFAIFRQSNITCHIKEKT